MVARDACTGAIGGGISAVIGRRDALSDQTATIGDLGDELRRLRNATPAPPR